MEEKKPINIIEKQETIKEEKKPLLSELEELREFKRKILTDGIKKRELKIPRKAKVRGNKLKKGWIGILKVDENRNLSGEKQRVSGSAYMTNDGTYHALEGDEIIFWNGKFPVVIQFTNKNSPLSKNLNVAEEQKENETFGDRYKMAKMLSDTIKVKQKGGNIIIWILIGAAVLFGINYIAGGGLFGG